MRRARLLKMAVRLLFAVGVVWAIYLLKAHACFRLYPVFMVALALALFARSLWTTPLVEVFARRMGECLDARGVAYCRNVTRVWVSFLAVHLLVTCATIFASDEIWILYNGCLSYLLMGALFLGEFLYRRRVKS